MRFLIIISAICISVFGYAQEGISNINQNQYDALEYRLVGPFRGGRSAAVTGVPNQPNLFYFGATGGGIWKTTNGGRDWENISDGYFGGSIGSIAISKSDPNVIYVGGGEKTVRGNVSSGYGMWKSEDAGKTWTNVTPADLPESQINSIELSGFDKGVAYISATRYKLNDYRAYAYKTTDYGKTWTKINKGVKADDFIKVI